MIGHTEPSTWLRRAQSALVRVPLLVVFGCVYSADRWPEFGIAAYLFAGAVVAVSMAGGVFLVRRASQQTERCLEEKKAEQTSDNPFRDEAERSVPASRDVGIRPVVLGANTSLRLDQLAAISRQHVAAHMAALERLATLERAQVASVKSVTWSLLQMALDAERISAVTPIVPVLPAELSRWKMLVHNSNSFNVAAGAFEIEHFHGTTHIRILDNSRVTVEVAQQADNPDLIEKMARAGIPQRILH